MVSNAYGILAVIHSISDWFAESPMVEKSTHRRAKANAAGKNGRTEVRISRNRRLDAITRAKAVEIETSGQPKRLEKAALRLKDSGKKQRLLVVPQKDMRKARVAIKAARTTGTVRNLSGTKYSPVRSRNSTRKGVAPKAPSRRTSASKK